MANTTTAESTGDSPRETGLASAKRLRRERTMNGVGIMVCSKVNFCTEEAMTYYVRFLVEKRLEFWDESFGGEAAIYPSGTSTPLCGVTQLNVVELET